MRTSSCSLLAVAALAACGGSSKPVTAAPEESGGDPAGGGRVMAPGTSGLPGLDWGAGADAIMAFQPRASADDTGYVYLGTVEGHNAIQHFTLGDGGLIGVEIEWTDGFISMEDCLATWTELRAELDGRFGDSQSDNGAAYWDLPAASVTLACNPNDSGAGVLSQTYEPKPAF